MKLDIQTTRIVIDIPIRDEGAPPVPTVTATRTSVLQEDDGTVVGRLAGTDDTRVLSNVSENPAFAAVHAALAAAIAPVFAPATEPEPEPEPEPAP
jgi:hypothetical protein